MPWWRRPVAAVAALALLGVVAISSLGIVALSGSGANDSAGEETAMMADTAEPGGGAQAEAEGGEAEGQAGAAPESGEMEAFGFDEGQASSGATEALRESAAAATIIEVPDLGSAAERVTYLEELRARPDARALLGEAMAQAGARGAQQREALQDIGLDVSCAEVLVPEGRAAVELLRTQVDRVAAVGAVTTDAAGDLTLLLVDRVTCEVLAEDQLPG